jgi:hypothetical protein
MRAAMPNGNESRRPKIKGKSFAKGDDLLIQFGLKAVDFTYILSLWKFRGSMTSPAQCGSRWRKTSVRVT